MACCSMVLQSDTAVAVRSAIQASGVYMKATEASLAEPCCVMCYFRVRHMVRPPVACPPASSSSVGLLFCTHAGRLLCAHDPGCFFAPRRVAFLCP